MAEEKNALLSLFYMSFRSFYAICHFNLLQINNFENILYTVRDSSFYKCSKNIKIQRDIYRVNWYDDQEKMATNCNREIVRF